MTRSFVLLSYLISGRSRARRWIVAGRSSVARAGCGIDNPGRIFSGFTMDFTMVPIR